MIKRLSDGEEFVRARCAVQLADEFGDERRADLGVECERGEHASFSRQRLGLLRGEESGDHLGLTLEVHADEEALKITFVGGSDLDWLAASTGSDGAFERRSGEAHHHAERGGVLHGSLAQSLDGRSANFGISIRGKRSQRFEVRRPSAEVA